MIRESIDSIRNSGLLRMASRRISSLNSIDSNGNYNNITNNSSTPSRNDNIFQESRRLTCLRIFFLFTLFIIAVVFSALIYKYASRNQRANFEHAYRNMHEQLSDGFQQGLDVMVAATTSLSAVFTAYSSEHAFPNVTFPHFYEKTEGLLRLTKARALEWSPLVSVFQRESFERYAVENAALVGASASQLSFGIYMKDESNGTKIPATGEYYDSNGNPARYRDTMSPVWQIVPVEGNSQAFLLDLRFEETRRRGLDDMVEFRIPTLTDILQLVQDDSSSRPSALLYSPVFSHFGPTSAVVGSIVLALNWDTLLANLLPNNVKGLVVVMETTSGSKYTFTVMGDEVILKGEGDWHDEAYDSYKVVTTASLCPERDYGQDSYIGHGHSHGHTDQHYNTEGHGFHGLSCFSPDINTIVYSLNIYPSSEFQAEYINNKPTIYAVTIAVTFLFTSLLFLLYDYLIVHHRHAIMRAAAKADAIVNSFYPRNVRERIFQSRPSAGLHMSNDAAAAAVTAAIITDDNNDSDGDNDDKPSKAQGLPFNFNIRSKMTKFLSYNHTTPSSHAMSNVVNTLASAEPIADLFDSATVMFADIAGFTSWSSQRPPVQVFQLLERLFHVYDTIALRLKIFKISTIGDCYLAVAGLDLDDEDNQETLDNGNCSDCPDTTGSDHPASQISTENIKNNHATQMCRFAMECHCHFDAVTHALAASLGDDTKQLRTRIGLHSGPVTAGVLRGLKSRFEIFGDTVNTASRMESTGLPRRIQMSEETRCLLIEAGRREWVVERKDRVMAKGKGEMQTYWLNMQGTMMDLPCAIGETNHMEYLKYSDDYHDVGQADDEGDIIDGDIEKGCSEHDEAQKVV